MPHGRHRSVCHDLRALRPSPDHGAAAGGGIPCQRQAGSTDLAAGGAECRQDAALAGPAEVQRRLPRQDEAQLAEPYPVLRFRRGPNPRRPQVPHAPRDRRVRQNLLGDRPGRQAELGRRAAMPEPAPCPSWATQSHPLEQWRGLHRQGRAGLARPDRCHDLLRQAGQPPEKTATTLASTASSGTSHSMEQPSTSSARQRFTSNAGDSNAIRSDHIALWDTDHRPRRRFARPGRATNSTRSPHRRWITNRGQANEAEL